MKNDDVVDHKSKEEAFEHFVEKVHSNIENTNSWMAVLWTVKDGKIQLNLRTTNNFPINDYLTAIAQLTDNFVRDAEKVRNAENYILPDFLPKVNLFEKEEKEANEMAKSAVDENVANEPANEAIRREEAGLHLGQTCRKPPNVLKPEQGPITTNNE